MQEHITIVFLVSFIISSQITPGVIVMIHFMYLQPQQNSRKAERFGHEYDLMELSFISKSLKTELILNNGSV